MPRLVFVEHDGTVLEVDAREGESVMRAAQAAGVAGILGECGGCMSCLTCHCYVAPADMDKMPPPQAMERELLSAIVDVRENSRLSCQIVATADLEGARFDLPEWQG
ncbi:2Fe-2S iron-sulfur cluster-binding protein [Sphingobium sp. HBC34]|uniref:2Fe-2S iron-sulfur cluster-binding protein n=1 Tax=Sphingobium cyanobacteriorum TaxID=3063954 RepID=A0ABT8ZGL1_9SPHN|nr:2Fe-2S iron-sulfur cluster-binding protein [Sphingobium sp. HBC34]MDO7833463.1 2Fe-2S iron-sulfur cluster-binding protein [Sphingobium sp. HBC34]